MVTVTGELYVPVPGDRVGAVAVGVEPFSRPYTLIVPAPPT